jgi:hypothetical protein
MAVAVDDQASLWWSVLWWSVLWWSLGRRDRPAVVGADGRGGAAIVKSVYTIA